MALKDILNVIAADAEKEAVAVRRAAEDAYRDRMQEAEHHAATARAGILAEAQTLAEHEKVRILHRVRLENLRQQVQVQQAAFLAAVHEAQLSLGEARKRPDYADSLAQLLAEAMANFDAPVVVVVHPDDEELIQEIARKQGLELHGIETRANLAPGVQVRTADGCVVVDNTLESRLQRAMPDLHALLADLLGVS